MFSQRPIYFQVFQDNQILLLLRKYTGHSIYLEPKQSQASYYFKMKLHSIMHKVLHLENCKNSQRYITLNIIFCNMQVINVKTSDTCGNFCLIKVLIQTESLYFLSSLSHCVFTLETTDALINWPSHICTKYSQFPSHSQACPGVKECGCSLFQINAILDSI